MKFSYLILYLSIFDEDAGKNDDILGYVSIDLSSLYMNELLEKKYPLRQRIDSDELARGKLSFSIHIEKCETLIRIDNKGFSSELISYEMYTLLRDEITHCLRSPTGVATTEVENGPIYKMLMKSPFLRADQDILLKVMSKGLMRDIMCDVGSLLKYHTEKIMDDQSEESKSQMIENVEEDQIPMHLLRCGRSLSGSICLDIKSGQYTNKPPLKQAVIILELENRSSCSLIFPDEKNHFLLWIWMRWLKLAVNIMKTGSELPVWAISGNIRNSLTTIVKNSKGSEEVHEGMCELTISPFRLSCNSKKIFDLMALRRITLSTDTVVPQSMNLQVEVVSANQSSNIDGKKGAGLGGNLDDKNSSDEEENDMKMKVKELEDKKARKKDRNIAMSLLHNTTKVTQGVVSGVAMGVSGVALGVTQGVTKGPKALKSVIAHSDPAKMLSHSFVVVKGVHASHTTRNAYGKHPVWGESVYFDVSNQDFNVTNVNQSERSENNHESSEFHGSDVGDKRDAGHNDGDRNDDTCSQFIGRGFQVFLYRGAVGMESLIGYQFVPYSLLLPLRSSIDNEPFSEVNSSGDSKSGSGFSSSFFSRSLGSKVGLTQNELQVALCDPKLGKSTLIFHIINITLHTISFSVLMAYNNMLLYAYIH
jgi:hypothetical protein